MYGLDISKTLNTEHHWKVKNFKVREDFFTGQLTYFLGKKKSLFNIQTLGLKNLSSCNNSQNWSLEKFCAVN